MWATLMLLGGAVGKSASCRCRHGLPTRWRARRLSPPDPRRNDGNRGCLPDRPYPRLFLMTPEVLHLVGIVGAVTLCWPVLPRWYRPTSNVFSLTHHEPDWLHVPRAWRAGMGCGIFHLMTHAFFKALLFLASGSSFWPAITNRTSSRWAVCVNHSAGLSLLPGGRRSTVGTAAVTAGFFSKDEILAGAMANGQSI